MSDPRPDAQKAREALDTIVHGDHHWTERGNVIAAYIDHAEAEVARLREALEEISQYGPPGLGDGGWMDGEWAVERAERALAKVKRVHDG